MDIGAIINNPMMGGMVEQGIKAFFKSGAVKVLGKTREGHLVISLKEPRVETEKGE
jgi:hypothetical protein